MVFVDRELEHREIELLYPITKTYTLFVSEELNLSPEMQEYIACRKGKRIARAHILTFLQEEARNYFSNPYGEKFKNKDLSVSRDFHGKVCWDGNYRVILEGDFGESLHQIAFWRGNIPLFEGQAIDLWLEYKKDPEISIALSVTQFAWGSLAQIQQSWFFTQEELDEVVVLDNQQKDGLLFVSLLAKGRGRLELVSLHDRRSRRGHGCFLPGGERYVTSDREEVFCYFDPGDRKPPLNVYFSGYKTRQGFEGYYLMRKTGCPFLLIAEQRLEGGGFYMGSEEYENLIRNSIRKYTEELGFSGEQVILSGISMGTYGTLYYGCDLLPHALIMGKPLASIGNVAANERIHRPGGFPTSLDVLHYLMGDTDEASAERLNRRFWDRFAAADWSKSKFIVSYMIEDDYDSDAYEMLISHLHDSGVQVYGRGLHGRHNDDTRAIISWFSSQYEKILNEDFSRKVKL